MILMILNVDFRGPS